MFRRTRGVAISAVVSIVLCFSSLSFLDAQQLPTPRLRLGTLENIQVHAVAMENNKLGDPADQPVAVYLPPSYKTSTAERYPSLYLLHGFDSNIRSWTSHGYGDMSLQGTMDALIAAGAVREMIVVVPNGRNAYLGSFYANSSVTGGWEDFILRDLVSYVDSHYRTVGRAAGRGIAGHSMGGYAAIMLGMKHPEVFSAVYAMSPCCLGMEADLTSINPAWHAALAAKNKNKDQFGSDPQTLEQFWVDALLALAAALSPNPDQGPLFVDLPYRDQNGRLVQDEPAWTEWHAKMPLEIVSNYATNLLKLRGLFIDYGMEDDFSHIPVTARLFSEKLARLGVPHILASYRGDHADHIRERLESSVLPFFSHVLTREKDEAKLDTIP
jgi:S-formylglutathione hydrolase FrmB